MSHRTITMDMLRLLGERHMTPFYYSSERAPYMIPWTYDEVTKIGQLDTTFADEGLDLADTLDVKYLFYNAENRVREHGGAMFVYYPETGTYLYGWHGTLQGLEMFNARMNPLSTYLRGRGWAERTLFYTNDEGFGGVTGPPIPGRDINQLIYNYSQLIHCVDPGFGTFIADNAGGNWITPLEETDHFAGVMSAANQAQFSAQGSVYWGIYNRNILLRKPLAILRITGLDYFFWGWAHHIQLEAFYPQTNPWINQHRYTYAGGLDAFFISGSVVGQGFSHYTYPWPEWRRPWEEGFPTLVSSLRFEALRESIDDYELVKMLSDEAGRLPPNSPLLSTCLDLLDQAETFVAESNMGDDYRYGGSHSDMVFDGDELDALLREIGQTLVLVTATNALEVEEVTMDPAATISFVSEDGVDYELQYSTDMSNWISAGFTIRGDGGSKQILEPVGASTQKNYRVVTFCSSWYNEPTHKIRKRSSDQGDEERSQGRDRNDREAVTEQLNTLTPFFPFFK